MEKESKATQQKNSATLYIYRSRTWGKHYSEDECLNYEREYFPLQLFKNSWEQPQLSGESKWDVRDWGHGIKEEALAEEEMMVIHHNH